MKAFRYSLQRLLDAKEAIEKGHQRRVAQAIRDLEQEQRILDGLREDVRRAAEWQSSGNQPLNAHDLTLRSQYLGFLRANAEKSMQRVDACRRSLAQRQAELQPAARERGSLERLREHQQRDWLQEFKRTEQQELDESASHQDLRNRRIAIRDRDHAT